MRCAVSLYWGRAATGLRPGIAIEPDAGHIPAKVAGSFIDKHLRTSYFSVCIKIQRNLTKVERPP